MSIWTKWLLEALPSLRGPRFPALLSKDLGRPVADTGRAQWARKGPQEQLGAGSCCKVGHRGTAHTMERGLKTVSALRGTGSWRTASGCLTGLQAGNSWGNFCGPRPFLCVLRVPAGLGDPGPLRLPGHSPKTMSSVRQEGPPEGKAGDTDQH